nr:hypothetical protein [Tanacetum cinerariifolium]
MNHDHSEELAQDLAEVRKKKKKSRESPKTSPGSPPPPPPPAESPCKGSGALSSSKTAASAEYQAWTTIDVRLRPSISLTLADLEMNEDMAPDEQAQLSNDEDIRSAHIPKVNLRQNWWKPLEEERPATPEPTWSISSSDAPIPPNNWASALASNYSSPPKDSLLAQTGDMATFIDWFCKRRECHKLLTDSVDDPILRNNVSKPLPLPALSISKMKAAYYPDAGLEQMVPDQFWINEECKYDIAVMYGISHWWFQRQRFYIDRHTSEGDRSAVRTHMRILSVVRIEVFSMYGYDYMKKIVLHRADLNEHVIAKRDFKSLEPPPTERQEDSNYGRQPMDQTTGYTMYGYDYMKKIVLRRADLNEHVIAKRDFKYLYPSDFEDLYLLNLQGHLNHLPPKDKKILTMAVNQWTRQLVIRQRVEYFQLGIESYQTQLNLTKPQWDATGFEYKQDYTVIDSPRADQQDESRFKYEVLDQEGRGSVQGVHVRYSEAFEYKADLPQPGELCWWTRQKGRLQTFKAYRMIKSSRHSRPLSDDL